MIGKVSEGKEQEVDLAVQAAKKALYGEWSSF